MHLLGTKSSKERGSSKITSILTWTVRERDEKDKQMLPKKIIQYKIFHSQPNTSNKYILHMVMFYCMWKCKDCLQLGLGKRSM